MFKALDTLYNAINGNEDAYKHILKEFDGLKAKAPKRSPAFPRERGRETTTPNPQDEIHRSAATSNTPSILERPYPILSGRRTVPSLVSTGGIPFLRYKSPQPATLSRLINDKLRAHEHRFDRKYEYQNQVQMGILEDAWDDDLRRYCGLKAQRNPGLSWKRESAFALEEVLELSRQHLQRNKDMVLDMYHVMERERALAKKEKLTGRDERHRRNKAKRLARREAAKFEDPDPLSP